MVLPQGLHTAIQEKKRAALLSIGSAALLLCLKTFLVFRTDSLGILSEALHSGLDLVAAVITFLSVRVSDQPADERHPYGHGKFENFSAFIETGLLILTAVYIIYEAFYRLFFHSVHIQPSITAILILLVALSIDMTRARTLNAFAARATAISLTPPSASPALRISSRSTPSPTKLKSASRKSFPRTSSFTQN